MDSEIVCKNCGTKNPHDLSACWVCRASLGLATSENNKIVMSSGFESPSVILYLTVILLLFYFRAFDFRIILLIILGAFALKYFGIKMPESVGKILSFVGTAILFMVMGSALLLALLFMVCLTGNIKF